MGVIFGAPFVLVQPATGKNGINDGVIPGNRSIRGLDRTLFFTERLLNAIISETHTGYVAIT
jgi:hypothetical protein